MRTRTAWAAIVIGACFVAAACEQGYQPTAPTEQAQAPPRSVTVSTDPACYTPTHVLTFTASSTCSLPAEAMQRVYEVEVDDHNCWVPEGVLVVTVVTPQHFASLGGNAGFFGTRNDDAVTFDIRDDLGFRLIEEIPSVGKLYFSGSAAGTVSGETMTATFKGRLGVDWPSGTRQQPTPTAQACEAVDHRMVLAPIPAGASSASACGRP